MTRISSTKGFLPPIASWDKNFLRLANKIVALSKSLRVKVRTKVMAKLSASSREFLCIIVGRELESTALVLMSAIRAVMNKLSEDISSS